MSKPYALLMHMLSKNLAFCSTYAEALPEYEKWLAMLIAPGTSMGGARPKAAFTQLDRTLWLAKFPAHDDRHDWGSWEYLTHQLAREAGIWVPASERCPSGKAV